MYCMADPLVFYVYGSHLLPSEWRRFVLFGGGACQPGFPSLVRTYSVIQYACDYIDDTVKVII